MCGRYVLKASTLDLKREFHLDEVPALHARYNIAPLQAAPVILDHAPRKLVLAQWGLLPRWAKDARLAHQLINARAETLESKPAFRDLLGTHRCLVPCDGFYEWRHEGPQRLPHFVHDAGGHLLAMAGLWSRWRSPDGLDLDTFTIITTRANAALRSLHERMPVFLDAEARERWLSGPTSDLAALEALLVPWHGSPLEITPVSQHVNSVTVDDERCLEPPSTVQLRLL
jgi:putative SOS response-associated peptidase YedK